MELVSQLSRQVEEAGAEVQILADKVDVTDRHQVAEAAEKVSHTHLFSSNIFYQILLLLSYIFVASVMFFFLVDILDYVLY